MYVQANVNSDIYRLFFMLKWFRIMFYNLV